MISSKKTGKQRDLVDGLAQTSTQERECEQKLRLLFEISKIICSFNHLQDVLNAIVGSLKNEFELDACSIRMLDDDGNLRIKSQKGLSKKFVETATRRPTEDSYSGECFLTGKITIVNDIKEIDKPISTTLLVGEDVKSFTVTPIKVEGESIGVLVTASKQDNYFHERFNDVIYIIANQIGIAIKISKLYEEIYNFSKVLEKKVEYRTKELREKSKRLIKAEKLAAMVKLVNRIADDCRNPLTVAGGFARRLYEKTPDNDPDKKYLKMIVDEVKILEDNISGIIMSGEKDV
ncbi:MAG: GAF domain-containing protein [Thermodesulfobacteriota bacterium]|nr:GAF domain-containing protein [Thermodesulfobacteriota bacterium]